LKAKRQPHPGRILVATGFHRPSTRQELIDKYGQDIVERGQIVMHVSTDDSSMAKIGTLPSGEPALSIGPWSKSTYGSLVGGGVNTLSLDAVTAYDPFGGSYAFSVIGFAGATAGGG